MTKKTRKAIDRLLSLGYTITKGLPKGLPKGGSR